MNSQSKHEQEGMDRISALPDVLIGHILSFLPTRYAVCTTVLSTRWNNLWRSLPNLDFYDKDFSENTKDFYMKFVDSVLSSCGSLDIRKLTIDFEHSEEANAEDLSRVLEWICAAIRHNVVDLDVSPWFKNRKPVWRDDGPKLKLPLSLLKCKTLEVFTLYSNCIAYPTTPTRGCFPNLKALSVKLPHGDFDSLDSLLSYLPVLEELTFDATYVSYINVLNMKICAPLLKTLRILLKYLNGIYMSPNNFFISAPKLEKVKLTDGVLTNYFLESTKCLERFEIAYMDRMVNHNIGDGSNNEAPRFAKRAAGLLEKCCHVKYLSLDTRPKCLEVSCVPALENLSELNLVLRDFYNWELLTELLKKSPLLQHLDLEHRTDYVELPPECCWNPPEFVPVCLSSSLKTISLKGFKGRKYELEVVKYLINYGEALNNVILSTKNGYGRQDGHPWITEEELSKEMLACPKGSKICQVEIIHDPGSEEDRS